MNSNPILSFAKKSLQLEYEAVEKLFDCIDKKFEEVLKILHNCSGRIIVTGVGKSGLIAQKIVATLNSTGTPAVYVHAGDASHGEHESIQKEDVVLCLSKSGQSSEIDFLIPYLKKQKNTLIAFTSNQDSKLALQSDFVIQIPDALEADQNNMIGHIPKNNLSNLVPLCEKCHDAVHHGKLMVAGYQQTGEGKKLQYTQLSKKEDNMHKTGQKKLTYC